MLESRVAKECSIYVLGGFVLGALVDLLLLPFAPRGISGHRSPGLNTQVSLRSGRWWASCCCCRARAVGGETVAAATRRCRASCCRTELLSPWCCSLRHRPRF